MARAIASTLLALAVLAFPSARAEELPWWVTSVSVTPPGVGGIGAVTLEGNWIDTGAPDAISSTILDGKLHLTVAAPDLNVGTGDAITPWVLTEEFGPLDPSINEITGSIFSVDPANRGNRQWVSGPDFLAWIYPVPRGEFQGLGSLNGSGAMTAAYDVSANGNVVTGKAAVVDSAGVVSYVAMAWSESTGMISLGKLPGGENGYSVGRGVSADGNYIVGDSTANDPNTLLRQEAFRWSLGDGMQGLGTLNGGYATSEARATSRHGEVVVGVDDFRPPTLMANGFAPLPEGYFRRAVRYTDETGLQSLGTLAEYELYSSSEAVDVSADGQVIAGNAFRGLSDTDVVYFDQAQPFLWTEKSGMVGLGNPARNVIAIYPPPTQETIANAVSSDGKIVVGVDNLTWSIVADPGSLLPTEQAVLWTEETGWQDLQPFRLPPGPRIIGSTAVDVSSATGSVIGQVSVIDTDATDVVTVADTIPFIWDEQRGMRPLAKVLAGDYGLDFEGWQLTEATAISDDGTTIVGVGWNPDGVEEAWRAVMYRTARVGDANFDGQVDQYDVAALSQSFGMTSDDTELYWLDGDFDADGDIDEMDRLLLLANYDGRSQGDFNADGHVDQADYAMWRNYLGSDTGIADATGDGLVTTLDLQVWKANFGATLTGSLAPMSMVSVPEPAAWWLALLGTTLFWRRRHYCYCR